MSQALYRKYRSRSLDEVVGQPHITTILKRAIEQGQISHAYLLTGPRGVGKTSVARIIAHQINNIPYSDETTHLDIIEIDAASNNSVDDIRDLREKVRIAPAQAPKKIYIIDEVHMLSKSAFNALLKTLEEPPEHVVFILATTDADKLPATILSRVQRFNFRTISVSDTIQHLTMIADKEHISIEPAALRLIAEHGGGSFRDSISLLDQLRSLGDETISQTAVTSLLGLVGYELIEQLLAAYLANDISKITQLLDQTETQGASAELLAKQLIQAARYNIVKQPELLPLLQDLLEVQRAHWPYIRLLTALAGRIKTQPDTTTNAQPKSTLVDKSSKRADTKSSAITPSTTPNTPITDFPWRDFLDRLNGQTSAYPMLARSSYQLDGQTLLIFAGKKFAKVQIDKSLSLFRTVLSDMGYSIDVKVLPTSKPPADSKKAAILAMMGGGEEITIDA